MAVAQLTVLEYYVASIVEDSLLISRQEKQILQSAVRNFINFTYLNYIVITHFF